MANPLFTLGLVAKQLGDGDSARTYLRESLAINRKIGDRGGIAYCLEAFASLAATSTDRDRAARLWGFATRLRKEIGAALSPKEQEELDREQALVRSALGEEGFFQARSESGDMALEQAIELALSA